MGKKEKALEKLRQNPRNVRYEDLEAVLLAFVFEKREAKEAMLFLR